jgi:thiamine monophosphate synthase
MAPFVPRILSISPPDMASATVWVTNTSAWAPIEGLAVLLRAPGVDERLVACWLAALDATGPRVILHARTPGAAEWAAARGVGIHLPSTADPAAWRAKVSGPLGLSCHSRAELERAQEWCDYATLSPIFPPRSKPDDRRPALGIDGLAAALPGLRLPVLALGGIGPHLVGPCRAAGAWGVAGIGGFGSWDGLSELAAALGEEG